MSEARPAVNGDVFTLAIQVSPIFSPPTTAPTGAFILRLQTVAG